MNQDMEKKLSLGLDYLEQGETVEVVLNRFPEDADVLRPFLEITSALSGLSVLPTVSAKQQSQAAFMKHAKILYGDTKSGSPVFVWLRRLLLPVAAIAVMVFLFGATLVSVSASALPGDALYQVKRSVENYRLSLTNDPLDALRLIESYQENRISEIEALLLAKRDADVEFEGEVQAIDTNVWVISGLPVQVNQETELDEMPEIGAVVRMNGRTHDGQLFAHRIVIIKGDIAPEPTPMPAIIPAEDPAEPLLPTIMLTVTSTPESTPTSTPPSSPTATEEAVLEPSVTPVEESATATPPPPENDNDDDANDNRDDDANENGDDDANDNSDDDANDNGDDDANDNGDDDANDNSDDDANNNDDDDANNNDDDDESDDNDDDDDDDSDDNDNDSDDNGDDDDDENDNGDSNDDDSSNDNDD